MKGIFVIIDGLGDLPCKMLGDKTPLEAAKTPNMDFFATRGELGVMYPVSKGFVPESDEALLSIFGNNKIFGCRGQLEALGADLDLKKEFLALRANFATISEDGTMLVDRRAGRTLIDKEAEELVGAINKNVKLPCSFLFKKTLHHRGVLVLEGGFSESVLGNDLTYSQGKMSNLEKVHSCRALDEDEASVYTVNILNEFIEKASQVLKVHPVNLERRKKGLMPANFLLLRGAGLKTPKLNLYRNWMACSYVPLVNGFAKASGMKLFSFNYPALKTVDSYGNLMEGLSIACKNAVKEIKNNYKKVNYAYVHFKETDLPGHDNKPFEKLAMIELLDKEFFSFLRDFCPQNNIRLVVTADHSTPCRFKSHSADPVPVLFYNDGLIREKKFSESSCAKGNLGEILGKDLFKKVDFVRD